MTSLTEAISGRIDGAGRTEDRRDITLDTAWLIRGQAGSPPSVPVLSLDPATAVRADPRQPTLIILSDRVPAAAGTASAVIRAGGRAYCLAPAGWSSQQAPDWLSGAPATSILVRRILEPPAAAVLSGDRGWIWTGPDGPGAWRLELDPEQVRAMRLAFLDLFWARSDDEAWPEDGRVQWRDRGEPPFDVPPTLSQDAVHLDILAGSPPVPTTDGALYAADGQLPRPIPRQLWVPPSGTGHAGLAGAVRRDGTVVWTDLGLPTCTTGGRASLRPSTASWTLSVRLNAEQATALADVLRQPPAAEFGIDVSLADAAARVGDQGRIWRAGQDAPERLLAEQVLDAGVVHADSLRDLGATVPPSWPEASPLALSVRYIWKISPPRPPAGAGPDPLVLGWRGVDKRFAERLTSSLAKLAATRQQMEELGREFPGRKGDALGFGRSVAELEAGLEGLRAGQDRTPSAVGPDGARGLLARLSELDAQVTALVDQVAAELAKARQEIDRERKWQAHVEERKAADEKHAAYTAELGGRRQRRAELETMLAELDANAADVPEKDMNVKRAKAREEQKAVSKDIGRLERRIKEEKAIMDRVFSHRPPQAPAPGRPGRGAFVPTASEPEAIKVPGQALPVVGRLLSAGGQRMLAISSWADLDQGEAEAGRLGARLVADGEGA